MTDKIVTVFLVDDDPGVLKGLSRLLRAHGYDVRPYTSPREFLAGHDAALPGCAVLDVSMPDLDGLELQQALLTTEGSHRPIVFVTGKGDVPTTVRAMKAGAIDFLTKPVGDTALLEAIERAVGLDTSTRQEHAEVTSIQARISTLTPREREVLGHVISGRLNKQIAGDLGTVEKTIKVHRARVMEKMGVRTVADLVRMAEKAGVPVAGRAIGEPFRWPNGQLDRHADSPVALGVKTVSNLIAIVDDDSFVLKALARLLGAHTFKTKTFVSAREFLASLPDEFPECLIADLQMPEMTGLELQQSLKREGIHIPTIIMTAHYEIEMRKRCEAAGAVAFLSKPLQDVALLGAIDNARRGAERMRPA